VLRAAAAEGGRPPEVALAFLPPEDELPGQVALMAEEWPGSLCFGCEAATQFAGGERTTNGSVQLFWFDAPPAHGATIEVVEGTHAAPPDPERAAALARRLAAAGGGLLLMDGRRFPAEPFLAELRRHLLASDAGRGALALIAGGLASDRENRPPPAAPGARVFCQGRVLPSACLAVLWSGVEMRVEVVRGWDAASPIYTVDRAAGNVIHEIDGIPATGWYRRFFTAAGELAPMPESAYRFPLIVEGPKPERQGLYRSMRAFDDPPGAVTFWASVETGDRVRLGMGNDVSLVRTASALPAGLRPEAAVLFSCACRELVLGDGAGREVAAIHQALGNAALSGFFTAAEIGPTRRGDLGYYNHTAILVLLSERRPAA
jgi:hypothetical protein